MKTVIQKHEIGCGIASVAMLGGITYIEARTILFSKGSIRLTASGILFKALKKLGREPLGQRMISLKNIDFDHFAHDCLVGTKIGNDRHWVVWDASAQKIRDPYKGGHKLKIIKYMPIL